MFHTFLISTVLSPCFFHCFYDCKSNKWRVSRKACHRQVELSFHFQMFRPCFDQSKDAQTSSLRSDSAALGCLLMNTSAFSICVGWSEGPSCEATMAVGLTVVGRTRWAVGITQISIRGLIVGRVLLEGFPQGILSIMCLRRWPSGSKVFDVMVGHKDEAPLRVSVARQGAWNL